MNDNKRLPPPELPKDTRVRERRMYAEIPLKKVLKLITDKCGNIDLKKYGSVRSGEESDVLIFLPMATREFYNMVYWGEVHPVNRYEQIYQGIGHIVTDGSRRIIIVSHFLYLYAAERTTVSACITKGKADSFLERIELERDVYHENERRCNKKSDGSVYDPFVDLTGLSEPVLYGHTHPNLGTFFSPPDRVSGFATPDLPAVTFVADPVKKQMKAGVGTELRDAHILVFSYREDAGDRIVNNTGNKAVGRNVLSEALCLCSELLNSDHNAKGRVSSYTTITGAQKFKADITIKPGNKNGSIDRNESDSSKDNAIVTEGRTYDSYA